ncbi:MAG: hypothetical protein Q8M09_18470 [Pseudomonadota bacterium]|nr:hypothetical protein [Pseudomonadota bacterium]MDP1572965.1 hypothetical protein [Pseudomonadota bacterium]MDP1906201.1 hypothetical protein [Pseudomonadota bacterium]
MRTLLLAVLLLLTGCDQLKERAGIHDPARVEAEGKAIGGACRHAGRGLEDCYQLNPEASIPAIYAGWKEMTEYMAKNNIEAVEPTILPEALKPPAPAPKKKRKKADAEENDAPAPDKEKDAGH